MAANVLRVGDRCCCGTDTKDRGVVVASGQSPYTGREYRVVWWDNDDVDECTRHGYCDELTEKVISLGRNEDSAAIARAWKVREAGRAHGTSRDGAVR